MMKFVPHIRVDGLKEGLMPVTPHILMMQGRCSEDADKYFISHISGDAVMKKVEPMLMGL